MYLARIDVYADEAIVDRYKGGFVHKFHRQAQCVVEFYRALIRRRIVTRDTQTLIYEFTDLIATPPDKFIEWECRWPFDFAGYIAAADAVEKRRRIADALRDALVWS